MESHLNDNPVDESILDASPEFQSKPNPIQLLDKHTQNFQNNPERSSFRVNLPNLPFYSNLAFQPQCLKGL